MVVRRLVYNCLETPLPHNFVCTNEFELQCSLYVRTSLSIQNYVDKVYLGSYETTFI